MNTVKDETTHNDNNSNDSFDNRLNAQPRKRRSGNDDNNDHLPTAQSKYDVPQRKRWRPRNINNSADNNQNEQV